jgi:hypothetical protein
MLTEYSTSKLSKTTPSTIMLAALAQKLGLASSVTASPGTDTASEFGMPFSDSRQDAPSSAYLDLGVARDGAYMAWAINLERPLAAGIEGITGGLEPQAIEEPYMAAAIRLWRDYFWPHARAALRQVGLTDRHRNARRVLRWISCKQLLEVSREDVRRDALGPKLGRQRHAGRLEWLGDGWMVAPSLDQDGGPNPPALAS